LHTDANETEELYNILYLHSKGITRKGEKTKHYISDWVDLMLYFLVFNYEVCQKFLNLVDVCGVNFMSIPSPHYSGNFWWTTSKYARNLPKEIGKEYLDPEMWVCKSDPISLTLWQSNIIHYYQPYDRSNYTSVEFIPQCSIPLTYHFNTLDILRTNKKIIL
jgi:hypothetical protein